MMLSRSIESKTPPFVYLKRQIIITLPRIELIIKLKVNTRLENGG